MNAASSPPRSGWVRSASARKARLISGTLAGVESPSTPSAQGLVPVRAGCGAAFFLDDVCLAVKGESPFCTRTQAAAHRGSISIKGRPAARSAAARASSRERAPPLDASGLRNGVASGGAVHQAAHRKRRRFVEVIETTLGKREVAMGARRGVQLLPRTNVPRETSATSERARWSRRTLTADAPSDRPGPIQPGHPGGAVYREAPRAR